MAAFGFTPASQQDVFSIETPGLPNTLTGSVLSGEEARQFYENLMKDDQLQVSRSGGGKHDNGRKHQSKLRKRESSRRSRRRAPAAEVQQGQTSSAVERRTGESEGTQRRQSSDSERFEELQGLRLLHCANEGDLTGLKELLSKGVDINFQDTFLWTAMMCASWSGQRAVVKLLLQLGAAWVGVVDMQGRDARDLALEAGHSDVLEELDNYGRSPQRDTQPDSSGSQPQWCEVCCSEFSSSLSSHVSSTLHQFNLRRPPPTPFYCLPPSSNSYKMMVLTSLRDPSAEESDREVVVLQNFHQGQFNHNKSKSHPNAVPGPDAKWQ
ncbi:hypothetical protein INR49_003941, partial [Caranx melampygus]